MPARAITPAEAYDPALINVEAEQLLLGALLSDNDITGWLVEKVAAPDFHEELHRQIFEAAILECDKGKAATPITLRQHFSDPSHWSYLAELTSDTRANYGARDHAAIVRDLAQRRRAVDAARQMLADASRPGENRIEDVFQAVDVSLAQIVGGDSGDAGRPLSEAASAAIQRTRDEAAGIRPAGIQTKFLSDWNAVAGRMRPGDLIILAGRPGMGKTTIGLNVAAGVAANGHGTLFVSLEMDDEDLALKAMADLSFDHGYTPSFEAIETGAISSQDWQRLDDARRQMAEWSFDIYSPGSVRVGRLGSIIRRYQRKHAAEGRKLELVVVDYLQLVRPDRHSDNRTQEVNEVSKGLKMLARELGVVVLALAQPNRECEKRPNKRPQLSDLRESGQIEQDADKVVFLYREEYYLKADEPDPADVAKREGWERSMQAAANRIEIYSAKVRKGPGGKRVAFFFADCQAVRSHSYFEDRYR